ncbi:MAG: sodium:proton antiporter [Actinobacteria bacterium]|nr:sodium:proton antiporter [Actinomycetota bacterium]
MDDERPRPDAHWDPGREETETERLDRNWASLLQELRVAQTGVQVLTGFLLTLPFQQRFADIGATTTAVYLITVTCCIGSTVMLVAPVSMHRVLFRRRKLDALVSTSHSYALIGLMLMGLALAGVAVLVFDVVLGPHAAWIAGGATLVALAALWVVLPIRERHTKISR